MRQTKKIFLMLSLLMLGLAAKATNTVTETLKETRNGVTHNDVTYQVEIYECQYTGGFYAGITYYTCKTVVTGLPEKSRATIEPFDFNYSGRKLTADATDFSGSITNNTIERLDILTSDFNFNNYLHAENLVEVRAKNLTVNSITATLTPKLAKLFISDRGYFAAGSCSQSVLTDVYVAGSQGPTWETGVNAFGSRIGNINLYVNKWFWDYKLSLIGLTDREEAEKYYWAFKSVNVITAADWEDNIDITVTAKGAWFNPIEGDAVFSSTMEPVTKTFRQVPYSDFLIRVQKNYGTYALQHVYLNGKDIISEMTEDNGALIYQLRDLKSDTYVEVVGASGSQYVELYCGEGGTLTYTDQDGEAQECQAGKMKYLYYDKTKGGEIEVTVTPQEGWEFALFTIGGLPITNPFTNPGKSDISNGYIIDNGNGTYKFYVNDGNLNKSRVVVFKRKAGDVNGDGEVDVNDIDEVVKCINQQP